MRRAGKKRGWRRALKWTLSLLGVASLGVVVTLFQLGIFQAERQAWPAYQRVVAGGTPLDLEGFKASFAVPKESNAAPELTAALGRLEEKLGELSAEEKRTLTSNRRDDPEYLRSTESIGESADALAKLEPELSQVWAASQRPHFVPDRDWSIPANTSFPEMSQLRTFAKTASLQARVHASRGESEKAISALRRIGRFAGYASDEPTMIGHLVDIVLRSIQAVAAQDCARLDPKSASAYSDVLFESDLRPLGRALRAEAFYMVSICHYFRTTDLAGLLAMPAVRWAREQGVPLRERDLTAFFERDLHAVTLDGLPRDLFARANVAKFLLLLEPTLATLNPDGTERSPGSFAVEYRKMARKLGDSSIPEYWVALQLLPALDPVLDAQETLAATRVLTRSHNRVLKFRYETGRLPANMAEAKADFPDPFAPGSGLRYRVEGAGFRVWSVGKDLSDEGGAPLLGARAPTSGPARFDVVVVYPPTHAM